MITISPACWRKVKQNLASATENWPRLHTPGPARPRPAPAAPPQAGAPCAQARPGPAPARPGDSEAAKSREDFQESSLRKGGVVPCPPRHPGPRARDPAGAEPKQNPSLGHVCTPEVGPVHHTHGVGMYYTVQNFTVRNRKVGDVLYFHCFCTFGNLAGTPP